MTDPEASIESYVEKIKEDDSLAESDRKKLLRLHRKLGARRNQIGALHHRDLLGKNYRLARDYEETITDGFYDEEVSEGVVAYIHRTYDSHETNRDYRIAYKRFSSLVTEGDGDPEGTQWISTSYSSDYDRKPDPSNLLREEEMRTVAEKCNNSRDAALIALAWDSGARPAELRQMLYKDITEYRKGFQAYVRKSKTERRNVKPLIASVKYVQRWLDEHPTQNDDDALWCRTRLSEEEIESDEPLEPISKSYFARIFQDAMDRTDIDKPHECRYYRKAMQAHLASQGVNEPIINKRAGRTPTSDAARRYTAVFGEEHVDKVAEAYGVELEDEETETSEPVECPRCDKVNEPKSEFCWNCHQALEYGAGPDLEEDAQQVRREVLSFAAENPGLLDDIDGMEQFLTRLDERPDMLSDARQFAEALDN
jgi:integrase